MNSFDLRRLIELDDKTISDITGISEYTLRILRRGGIAQVSEAEHNRLLALYNLVDSFTARFKDE